MQATTDHPTTRRLPVARLTMLLAAAVLAAACGGPAATDSNAVQPGEDQDLTADEATEEDEPTDAPEEPADADPADEPGDEPASTEPIATAPSEDENDDATATLTTGFDEDELTVFATDGSTLTSFEVPDGRLDTFADVVVHPDASATDLDAVVVVLRGEVYRLYHLEVADGDQHLTEFPAHLQPQDLTEAKMTLAWTPDARSMLWTEPTADGATLRSVGWDGGPGTGRPADDNASFALDLPADVAIDGFEVTDATRWTVALIDGLGTLHEVPMERQADGALALPS